MPSEMLLLEEPQASTSSRVAGDRQVAGQLRQAVVVAEKPHLVDVDAVLQSNVNWRQQESPR